MTDVHLGIWLDAGSRIRSMADQLQRHLDLVRVAERNGFDSVWIGETFSFGMPSPFQWLAALAPQTELRLGTGVVLLPTWQPLRLISEAAMLDAISDGRFDFGIGVGRRPLQLRFGLDPTRMAEYADEVLEMLRVIWGGGDRFTGSLVRVEGPVEPRPVQPGGPPIWVAGSIRRSILRAATLGDGWYASTTYSFDHVALQAERYRAELAARGATGPVEIAANRLVLVAETDDEADALAARYLGPTLRRYATNGSLGEAWRTDPAGPEEAYRRLRDDFCLVGSTETVGRRIRDYAAIGMTHLHARILPDEMPVEVAAATLEGLSQAVAQAGATA